MSTLLEVDRLASGYGRAQILFDLSFSVAVGEVVVLIGRNGAGKSTTLETLMGMVRAWSGDVRLEGRSLVGRPAYEIAREGVGFVPEERRVFADLTVMENLEVGRRTGVPGAPRWSIDDLFEIFPNLAGMRKRLAGHMSGGEQQMLAIARTLMGNPRLLLLDEPSEGLAPLIVDGLAAAIERLKRSGLSMVLAEQSVRLADRVGDRAYTLTKGRAEKAASLDAAMAATSIS